MYNLLCTYLIISSNFTEHVYTVHRKTAGNHIYYFRNVAVGGASTFARVGSISAPYIVDILGNYC